MGDPKGEKCKLSPQYLSGVEVGSASKFNSLK